MAAAGGEDVIVEIKDPSDPSPSEIPMQPMGKDGQESTTEVPKPPARSFIGRTLGRLNPFGPKDPEAERVKAEAKAKAAEEKKRKAEEKKRKEQEESDDPGDIPDDPAGKCAWLRRVMRKWLPPPWNYLLAGSPTTAGLAFGGYWLWNHYLNADTKME